MNVAIIGYGYWGPNLLRNFNAINDCKVHSLCDLNTDRLAFAQKQYPGLQ